MTPIFEKRGRLAAILAGVVLMSSGCAALSGARKKSAAETSAGEPAPALALPSIEAPVLRIGLASDQPEFLVAGRSATWIVAAGADVRLLRGPLQFRPEAQPLISRVQVGAFSEDEAARRIARKFESDLGLESSVVFSAEKGLYLVRLGSFIRPEDARPAVDRLAAGGVNAFVVTEASGPSAFILRDESGAQTRWQTSEISVASPDPADYVAARGKKYRGRLRLVINRRGSINVVNDVNLEDYLKGVVPAEMGPKKFDELEGLKAQAVAARTYALDNRGQFESEGFDLCATPKCQVYAGVEAEDPLSDAAVQQTRGLVARSNGRLLHALFVSTCGGRTEDVELVFPAMSDPALKSVECGEEERTVLEGAVVPKEERGENLSLLEWRGAVLSRYAASGRGKPARSAVWKAASRLAGIANSGSLPGSNESPYAAILSWFRLNPARDLHLTDGDRAYFTGPPDPSRGATADARTAYETFLRLKIGGEAPLPPPGSRLTERETGGLLFSAALRLAGVQELSGRFARRDGAFLVVKTAAGRVNLEARTSIQLARRAGGRFFPSSELALRPGDAVTFWKKGNDCLGLWADYSGAGAAFEKESAWTEWVRRISGKELMLKIAARVAGKEVKAVEITKRSKSLRAIEGRITTDQATLTASGFDLRQVLELPELLFTVVNGVSADGSPEFVFIGRGWGHGVGLCQNGAYGMALAGAKFDEILKHYYTGIEIGPLNPPPPAAVAPATP